MKIDFMMLLENMAIYFLGEGLQFYSDVWLKGLQIKPGSIL